MLHVSTPLSDEAEKLIHDVIGCCIAVHRALGPGLLEVIYSRAIALELTAVLREVFVPSCLRGQGRSLLRLRRFQSLPLRLQLVERQVCHRPS
jgi:hypothetical protein